LIVFEGIDGSGKTTALASVAASLRAQGLDVVTTREPGGTAFGTEVRALVFAHAETIGAEAELLLMCADRAEHVRTVIRPALKRGATVISDRFAGSTIAYQGFGRRIDLDLIATLTSIATGGLSPDLTLLFDVDLETAFARRQAASGSSNALDLRDREYRERVRAGYLEQASTEPGWIVLDGNRSPADVARDALAAVSDALQP
jgi:dTMP kinase